MLFAAALALGASAHAQPSLFDQLFERHVRVKCATSPGVLHLLYERKADPQAAPASCYRRYAPGKGWLGEERLQGAHRCVAFLGDALYVFRRNNYSIYQAKDWTAHYLFREGPDGATGGGTWQSGAWPLEWAPEAACRVGDAIWVFGTEASDGVARLRAARLGPPSGHGASGPEPVLLGKPLGTTAPPADLTVLGRNRTALVFWHQETPGGQANELWHATFDGDGWSAPLRVPAPYAASDYAAAEHEGAVWLVCKERGRRLSPRRPLVALALSGERWSDPATVPNALDTRLDWTLDVDAASFDGSLFVFRACMDRLVAHRWRGGSWGEPEVLFQLSPWPTYVFWWLLGNVAASMLLLPVVAVAAVRTRLKPRFALRAFGVEAQVTSWARRVAAQLVDIVLVLLLHMVAATTLNVAAAEGASDAEAFVATVGLSSALYLAYFVLAEGLTGQSFGKLLLRIAVVGPDGARPSLPRVVLRNLLRPWPFLVPAAYLIGSLTLLLTRTSQRLGDLLAGTYVVDLPIPAPRPLGPDDAD